MPAFSENQMRAITTTAKKVVVHSGAGAGKTACLAARVKWLLNNGYKSNEIVAITFTNNAADTMLQRIGNYDGLKVCTLHSYVNQLLLEKNISTSDILEQQKFDKLFEMLKLHPECIKPVRMMLVDEAHDLTHTELSLIFDIIKPKEWMIFFDEKQHIYSFKEKEESNSDTGDYGIKFGLDLMKQANVTVIEFYENFRNGSDILNFSRNLIAPPGCPFYDSTKAMRTFPGKVVKGSFIEDEEQTIVAQYFKIYNNKLNCDFKDWFILVRTNAEIDKIGEYFKTLEIPYDTFKQSQLDIEGIKAKMDENTVKILTIHSAKGLENKNVIFVNFKLRDIDEDRLRYVGATRAKDLLIWLNRKPAVRKQPKRKGWF